MKNVLLIGRDACFLLERINSLLTENNCCSSHPAYSSPCADPEEPVLCYVSGPGHAAVHRHHAHRRSLLFQQVKGFFSTRLEHEVAAHDAK